MAGLSLQKLVDVVSAGGVNSGMFQNVAAKVLQGDLAGSKFTLANAMKDLRYYAGLAASLPSSNLVGGAVLQSLLQSNQLGFGDRFVPSLVEVQERLTGKNIVPRKPQ
jgi:3-hydroxyisobutyrate dehydrogenase-like beta-hydroxyacid dehydrogenase